MKTDLLCRPAHKVMSFVYLFQYFLGHEDYDGLRIELYKDADIFLVCFDIGNPESLTNADDVVGQPFYILFNYARYIYQMNHVISIYFLLL